MMFPKLTETIKHIVIICCIMYFAPSFLNLDLTNIMDMHFPKNENYGFWQYLTHIFMHASPRHLLYNMLTLWMFGYTVELYFGQKRFLFIFLSAGIGAGLLVTLVDFIKFNEVYVLFQNAGLNTNEILDILNARQTNDIRITQSISQEQFSTIIKTFHKVSLGASAAVFGILGASAIISPNSKSFTFPIPIPIPNKIFVGMIVLSDLVLGTFSLPGDNVGRFAHVFGAIIGVLITLYWKKK